VWRRLRRWGKEGVWELIWRAALAALDQQGKLDWSMAFLDGSFAPAKKGGDKVGLSKKGKGTKWMLVVDGNGLPLGFCLASANTAEVKLAEQTLDTIGVSRPRGRPKRRPEKLVADRAYDSSALRSALRRRGIRMCIPAKRRPATWRAKRGRPVVARKEEYQLRYTVERSFAWLGNYRRLLIRWEHPSRVYQGFFTVAVLLISLRRLFPSTAVAAGGGRASPTWSRLEAPCSHLCALGTGARPPALLAPAERSTQAVWKVTSRLSVLGRCVTVLLAKPKRMQRTTNHRLGGEVYHHPLDVRHRPLEGDLSARS
jgi:transposase